MTRKIKPLILLVIFVLTLGALTACSLFPTEKPKTDKVTDVIIASQTGPFEYMVLFDSNSVEDIARNAAVAFADKLYAKKFVKNSVISYSAGKVNEEKEIIFGASDREASKKASELVDAKVKKAPDDFHWAIAFAEGRLAVVANSERGYELAIDKLFSTYLRNGKIIVKSNLVAEGTLTYADYKAEIEEQERREAAAKKAENKKILDKLLPSILEQRNELSSYKGKINAYTQNDPQIYLFKQYTQNIGTSSWGTSPVKPESDQHPRLLITEDMLPDLRSSIKQDNAFTKKFLELLDATLENDGILPAKTNLGVNGTVDTDNIHNYDDSYLELIQAKALAYLIYDDELYGYQAIYYMKNFIKSLDIEQIASDQCRQYGYTMFTAAIVYDWCYDLLTEKDKEQFIAGVENCLCRGSNANGVKMEVGFPPSKQGSVSGHGSEYQILRDYLAFATAIYDENPSWWNYVAARVCNDYVEMRNHYFQSGIAQQGTGYATARHICDLYSAWIIKIATGTNPYVGMENTVKSFIGYEYTPGTIFTDGDNSGDGKKLSAFADMAYIGAYLYGDETLLAQAMYLKSSAFSSNFQGLSTPVYLALTAIAEVEPAEDRYEGMELIQYNGSPLGQYVIRASWNDPASAAVFMRIKERSTANHEHYDSGTFEIYYKGMLTSDGGMYNNYSHEHTKYFHKATISHNGLIIYNPSLASTEDGWYSGGQERFAKEASTLDQWLTSQYDTGTVTGRQHGYVDGDKSKPLYAYIAGDITEAYSTKTVSYVGRRMLTVYTGDAEYPMVFFVYDDISSTQASYQKRFLLQISSKNAPAIDETAQTVITENGDGRLVLTCLSDNVKLTGMGGRNSGKYDATQSQNYLINGQQLVPKTKTADDGHWGRVEIEWTESTTDAEFMNVLYVTDKGNTKMATVKAATSESGLTGGTFNSKIAALFATSRTEAKTELSCKTYGSASMDYYVSGLAAGKWKVTVDGKTVGTYTATEEGGLLTFTAPAGSLTVTPA